MIGVYQDSGGIRRRAGVLALLFAVLFLLLLGRLFYIQIIRGDEYRQEAVSSFSLRERLPARRGKIRDRNGNILANNVPTHRLRVIPERFTRIEQDERVFDEGKLEAFFKEAIPIFEWTKTEEEELLKRIHFALESGREKRALVVEDTLVSDRCPIDGHELELSYVDNDPRVDAPKQLFCRENGGHEEWLETELATCPHDHSALSWSGSEGHRHATCSKCKRHYTTSLSCEGEETEGVLLTKNLLCPHCKRRFIDQVSAVKHGLAKQNPVLTDIVMRRVYTQAFTMAHLLGYMNSVTREDLDAHPGVYHYDSRIGRTGVEAAFEAILRGKDGWVDYLRGTRREVETERVPSQDGRDVWLTIDTQLQKEVRQILRYQRSAGAVVMHPKTGEILALYSHPGFDPNAWSSGLSKEQHQAIENNPYIPMFNKALTAYAPGSGFKIVSSLAGLKEGVVDEDTVIFCGGHYTFGGRDFRCHSHHGDVNLEGALKGSCDVYFYQVAEQIGMDKLSEYAHQFGFGEPTGIEIAESLGVTPTRAWYRAQKNMSFQPGLSLSVGIGQGALTATPLQVTRSFAMIANGGKKIKARIIKRDTDQDGLHGQDFLPVDEGYLDMTEEERALIHKGLVDVVNAPDGTAKHVKDDLIVIAGKTGTAEAAMTRPGASPEVAQWLLRDHAWFTLYAPAENPQVVITVFLEHGGAGGRHAAPLARRIFDAWRRLGLYDEPLDLDSPKPVYDDPITDEGEAPPSGEDE